MDKWYLKTRTIVIALLLVGPLALPLIWMKPEWDFNIKIILTVLLGIATWGFTVMTINSVNNIMEMM
jgi:hypothetical protein